VDFGAWITVDGFFLNDAMTNFAYPTRDNCSANFPAGSKRPVTAMAPVVALDQDHRIWLVGGSAGAGEIVDYITQAIVELSAGRSPTAALDDGHVSTARAPYAETPGLVELEQGRAIAQLAPQLRILGHNSLKVTRLLSGAAFLVKRDGHWEGAADPRRDGTFATDLSR
jgi:gamma-glutamyltranspeptidase/glutathione hydrolase